MTQFHCPHLFQSDDGSAYAFPMVEGTAQVPALLFKGGMVRGMGLIGRIQHFKVACIFSSLGLSKCSLVF